MHVSFFFKIILVSILSFFCVTLLAQEQEKIPFFEKADQFHAKRFWVVTGVGAATYTGTMIGLNELWYKDFEKTSFQFYDDRGEWNDMDKAGHAFSAYNQSRLFFEGARWMGLKRRTSMWIGVGMGTLLQGSIEILDAHSAKWGFSVADIAYNTLGCGLFAGQELLWKEQRFIMKVSSSPINYSSDPILSVDGNDSSSLERYTNRLFGSSYPSSFLKDYNAQTIWLSGNIHAFTKNEHSKIPKWLNVAVGYGAGNLYGGFGNNWTEGDAIYKLSSEEFPRYRQFYLSLDIDLTRIKTKNRFLRTVFQVVNMIKIPAPTLEYNTLGQWKFHPVYF